jgi:hypothetical protein
VSHLDPDLAHAVVAERQAAADRRRLVSEVRRAHKLNRDPARPGSGGSWLRRLFRRHPGAPEAALTASGVTPRPVVVESGPDHADQPAIELHAVLDVVARQIYERGTHSAEASLTVISSAVSGTMPGTAAALIDWEGAEVLRLRAFGVAHGVAIRTLDPNAQRVLLARIRGTEPTVELPADGRDRPWTRCPGWGRRRRAA